MLEPPAPDDPPSRPRDPRVAAGGSGPSRDGDGAASDGDLLVVVAGMHRSGTSAVAGALDAAGVSAGPHHELMPARAENPRFFGERLEVAAFDDRLLASLGWTWDAPAAEPPASPQDRTELVAEGRALVADLVGPGRTRLIKDPRISLLLPWWRRILLDRCVLVVPIRAPEEVAWSLSVRDGHPFELGLALWLTYHRHLAAGLDGLPAVLVRYDALTEHPAETVPALLAELRRLGVRVPEGSAAIDAAVGAIQPALRRATQPVAAAGTPVAAEVARAAQAWRRPEAVSGLDRFSLAVEPSSGWERALLDIRREAASLGDELAETRRSAAQAHADAADATRRAEDARRHAGELAAALERQRLEAEALAERAARLERRLALIGRPMHALRSRTRHAAVEVAGRVATLPLPVPVPRSLGRHPLFDATWYLASNPDVAAARLDPWRHYRRHGAAEGRAPNAYLDPAWYLARYPDVRAAGLDPIDHYLRHGAAEGRDPSPWFDTGWYLQQNPDVAAAGLNPLAHFLEHGAAEGRLPHPDGDLSRTPVPVTTAMPVVTGLAGRPAVPLPRSRAGGLRGAGGGSRGAPAPAEWLASLGADAIPDSAVVLLVPSDAGPVPSRSGSVVHPFPVDPADGGAALLPPAEIAWHARLAVARAAGATHLAIPSAAEATLAVVPGFVTAVEARFAVTHRSTGGIVLDVRSGMPRGRAAPTAPAAVLRATIDRIGSRQPPGASDPSVLDLTAAGIATSISAAGGLAGAAVFAPLDGRMPLAYPDASVDLVVVDAADGAARAEADRIAVSAIIEVESPQVARAVGVHATDPADAPSVSIVIPTHGGARHLAGCLPSLAETLPEATSVEIVVVDDASGPAEAAAIAALVAALPGARLLVNDTNAGFLASVTRGIAATAGALLVLLNDDTLLLPGWLEAILATFAAHPDAGVVGGRLLYPDGRLQEAGGLVFRDGSAAKLGGGLVDPDAPIATTPRDTDYVSGALLATPRVLFDELGGLDPGYGFGFYEDTDYCFRVRAAGRRVLYQPAATIVHVEGGTAGTDTAVGPKRSQVENAARFRARWAPELERQPEPPPGGRMHAWYAAAIRRVGAGRPPHAP